ncbi:MAG: ion channel [Chitinophagaceae bacterium]
MSLQKGKLKSDPTTGFGVNSKDGVDRLARKDGSVNVIKEGVSFFDGQSLYHTMLSIPKWKFWTILFTIYLSINVLFAFLYLLVGIEHLGGIETGAASKNFMEAFFFSTQTYTTVGYGRISPIGVLTSAIASFEAFMGVLSFALASGLFYGRFSRPKAYLYFSDIALLSPYKDGTALMFRMVPYKNNQLTEAEVKLTLAMQVKTGDVVKNEFYQLPVEFSKLNSLALNWTVVHAINEESPLWGLSLKELREAKAEILVFLKAFDEVFSNSVVARTSYIATEFIENAKFKPMYHASLEKKATILHIDALNDFDLLS